MKPTIRIQLFSMMFLNFFVWGIWFVTLGTYLLKGDIRATDAQVGLAFGTQCLGAIIAPFIIGLIADKYFAAQKILGILHLAGAVMMYLISGSKEFTGFYTLLVIYMVIYMPTLALCNSIALNQVSDAEKEFGGIRLWGTIGWIIAGQVVGFLALEANPGDLVITFKIAAAISLVFGIYSFFLPNTPPPKAGKEVTFREIIGLDALNILKLKNYAVFFAASILICIPLAFYYGQANIFLNELGMEGAAQKMSLGQMSEAVFLFLMPWFFRRLGVKYMLLVGMLAWVIRYLCFTYGDVQGGLWMLYLGIILHGVCYDFFFVTGNIYTDQVAGPQVRSSAQGLITLATYGLGMYIGFWAAGAIAGANSITDAAGKVTNHNWEKIWMFPALFAAGVTILFILLFKNPEK